MSAVIPDPEHPDRTAIGESGELLNGLFAAPVTEEGVVVISDEPFEGSHHAGWFAAPDEDGPR